MDAFDALLGTFSNAPFLAHFDPALPCVVEADASDVALGVILSQRARTGTLHPLAFYSRKLLPNEINYQVHDKELLAIVAAFEQYRHFLESNHHRVLVYSDHRNLQYFNSSRLLNRRQVRWSMYLQEFAFDIVHRAGSLCGAPDALSRRPDLCPTGQDDAVTQQTMRLFAPGNLIVESDDLRCASLTLATPAMSAHIASIAETTDGANLIDNIRHACATDPLFRKVKAAPEQFPRFRLSDGLLYFHERLFVPDVPSRLSVLAARHDSRAGGHFGTAKTLELIRRDYWWPRMRHTVQQYIASCDTCQRNKLPRMRPHGLLHPLSIPAGSWRSLSTDFITDLPKSRGYDSICVITCRRTKMVHFVACNKAITAPQFASLFINTVYRQHGLPDDIGSDRGPQFVSNFWRHFCKLMGITVKLSSAFHPETDGQTERVNSVLEQDLRCFVSHQQTDWHSRLAEAEFSFNNSVHSASKMTPFHVDQGHHPKFDFEPCGPPQVPAASERAKQIRELQLLLTAELHRAQAAYKRQADKKPRPEPAFRVGDQVWLIRRHVKTTRAKNKLDHLRLGPFPIVERLSRVAFRLQLPPSMHIHNVFHVSLLLPYASSPFPDRHVPLSSTIALSDNKSQPKIAEILDSSISRRKRMYLVRHDGAAESDAIWVRAQDVQNDALIAAFEDAAAKRSG